MLYLTEINIYSWKLKLKANIKTETNNAKATRICNLGQYICRYAPVTQRSSFIDENLLAHPQMLSSH
jgi:hypothetical protein